MVVPGREVPGAKATGTRYPYRGMRLLNRPRPKVDHRELIIFSIPGEDFLGLPSLEDEVMGLVITVPVLDGRDTVAEIGVHRRAQGHPRDQSPTTDAVQHGVLFADAGRRVGSGQSRPHLDNCYVHAVGGPGHSRTHQVGTRHESVGVLMMLVNAQPVQPGMGGIGQFVQCPVVVLANSFRIGQLPPRRVYPNGVIPLLKSSGSSRWGIK
jgi:hypothetical protein